MRTTAKLALAAAASTGLLLGAQGLASADENPFWQQPQQQQEQQQPQQQQEQEQQQPQQQQEQEQQQPQQEQQPQQQPQGNAWNDTNQDSGWGAQNDAQQDISPSAWALWGAWTS
ncbi:hypothetical protein ACH347_10865 [Saccharopolyspora sp. 5N102]|uniref:hypothetical protein n=1 Tax=Saccharopolyspora sp. 5N102 TaxID=3375155 RepID=UPI0037A954F2